MRITGHFITDFPMRVILTEKQAPLTEDRASGCQRLVCGAVLQIFCVLSAAVAPAGECRLFSAADTKG